MKGQRKIILLLFLLVSGLLFIPSITTGEETGKIIVAKGTLTTEKCLKEPLCYLEWYGQYALVLFTGKRTQYHIEANEVPKWKFDAGFGKQVAIKGILKGNKILVNDIIPLEGGGKMSKACL
ncbi:MAG: hypothetical protein A3F81_03095 [Nitrospinae bacterium RIFCSPLOWO2_12_FULL_39_93]|nr:MAG: hypothetical protein A3F81_03095 [Nitrospinae bacterium RIFCSPLOWO2_12_FULL_39_93]